MLVVLAGCTSSSSTDTKNNDKIPAGKADAWNDSNNPQRFKLDLEYNFDTLSRYTLGYAEQIPWPSDYWPHMLDSTNARYWSELEHSPLEKFDMAFNNWVPNNFLDPLHAIYDCENGYLAYDDGGYYQNRGPAARWQHENKGIYRVLNGIDDDQDGLTDECDADTTDSEGDFDGIEPWWGLCHAWVPASLLEPEPARKITVNGVEFTVSDIKALILSVYDRVSSVALGDRCNEFEIHHDEFGRVTESACRDTNAGAFHVIITNMLGIHHRAFAEDRTNGHEVWNHPVLGYQILEQREVSEQEAMQLLGRPGEKYTEVYNSPEAVSFRYVSVDTDYVDESDPDDNYPLIGKISEYTKTDHYEYILELDADNLIVGGEWLNSSIDEHPDFLWLPLRPRGGNPYMSYAQVKQLLELSLQKGAENTEWRMSSFGGDLNVDIPDNDQIGISQQIEISEDIPIGSLKVRVDIGHTNVGDLKLTLTKDDTSVVLQDCVLSSDSGLQEVYSVKEFDGQSAKGIWKLTIADLSPNDFGKLQNFSLYVRHGSADDLRTAVFNMSETFPIPDNDENGVQTKMELFIDATVKSVKVRLNIDHPMISDLKITLKHGYSEQVLHSFEGGDSANIYKDFKVDSFAGLPLRGEWILSIVDNRSGDKGTLKGWWIEIGV
jgi:subtilisin-like proprotein convertase family protein